MAMYIVLIRGVNVGGHGKIRMADLRAALEDSGFADVATYLQSGNVVLNAAGGSVRKVAAAVRDVIVASFKMDPAVFAYGVDEFRSIVSECPFTEEAAAAPSKVHVMFLASPPTAAARARLEGIDARHDRFHLGRRAVHLHYPNGVARAALTSTFLERKLETLGTARNFRTVQALVDMANDR